MTAFSKTQERKAKSDQRRALAKHVVETAACEIMSSRALRAQVYDLMRKGFYLKGQTIHTSNGSLQAAQAGAHDALKDLYDRVRNHKDLWDLMIQENSTDE